MHGCLSMVKIVILSFKLTVKNVIYLFWLSVAHLKKIMFCRFKPVLNAWQFLRNFYYKVKVVRKK